jgi:hypothetical protein
MQILHPPGVFEVNWTKYFTQDELPLHLYQRARKVVIENGLKHSSNLTTLGLPLYVAEHNYGGNAFFEYFKANQNINEFLHASFKALYKALTCALSEFFGLPIYFHPQLALPGFHLFRSGPGYPYHGGGWHVDRFAAAHVVPQRSSWSATLILGSSSPQSLIEFKEADTKDEMVVAHAHKPGFVTLFRSDRAHRVGAMTDQYENDRVSLQAHIAVLSGCAVAFW